MKQLIASFVGALLPALLQAEETTGARMAGDGKFR
jgi:hypothetical protein